jgi:hypothetical protein
MAPTGSTMPGLDQLEPAADDIEHVLGFFVLVEQDLAGGALALGHERLQPFHREVAVDGFLHVAHQLQHLVQAIGIDQQHDQLHPHHQEIMGRDRGHDQTTLARMPKTRSGIMVRIVVVATTKIDANSAPAGSCVLCQMRRIHWKPTNI